jgi:coatomer subunit gamma
LLNFKSKNFIKNSHTNPTNNFPLLATFGATLKFVVKDCDPSTGLPDSEEGYDDEYMLEDFEITVADQVQKTKLNNFVVA